MQTKKPSNYQDLKKSICKNYIKDACPYGKDCKFRHPAKQQERETEVCKYYLQNKCRRGNECPFLHRKPKSEKKQRPDWLTFCLYFPNGQCKNKECRFLHVTEEDKNVFRSSGKIVPHLLEQAMCKALLQDVTLDGNTPTCKDYLQGCCEWMSCPMLHITRQEFSQAILGILTEKFEAVLGPREGYHAHSKSANKSTFRYQEPHGYDMSPAFQDQWGQERCMPASNEPYGSNYGKKPSWYDERVDGRAEYDPQDFISSETDRIIKGIYNLMRGDANFMRNSGKQDSTDLRGKLNHLAEENVRYRYECSRQYPHDGDGYKPLIPMVPGTDDYKYQDVVRRLERENMEMRRQLSMFQEREHIPFHTGRYGMPQEGVHRGGMRGQSYIPYDRRMYGLPKPVTNHGPPYNPLKQKVNSQIRQNMSQQYKKPQQMKQGASQYGKMNYPKYPKQLLASKKNQPQFQKTQLNFKGNQIKKTNPQVQSPNEGKSENTKNVTKEESSKEDDQECDREDEESSGESEVESDIRDTHSSDDLEDSSEDETRINETRTEENEEETEATEQDNTRENPLPVQEENRGETTESEEPREVTCNRDETTESEETREVTCNRDETTESEETREVTCNRDETTESEETRGGACNIPVVEVTKPEVQKEDGEKKEEKKASDEDESEAEED